MNTHRAAVDLSRIDLNLFLIFDVIYREQNLTRASEELHLSQPAVSHALNRLRESLNDDLFQRVGRKMIPTPYAKVIISRVREALGQLQTTLADSLEFDPLTEQRTFTFACRDVLEVSALPLITKQLQKLAPNIQLRSVRSDRQNIEAELIRGDIDFAADVLIATSHQIQNRIIKQESISVVMSKHHPLMKMNKQRQKITLAEYLQYQHVLVTSRLEGLGIEDVALSKIGKKRNIQLRCQNYLAANKVVAETNLLATMPTSYAKTLAKHQNNLVFDVPFKAPSLNVHLYWNEQSEQDPAIMWLLEEVLTQLHDLN